jgi:hypothetical protein
MAATDTTRPGVRLIRHNGARLESVGPGGRAANNDDDEQRSLSDAQAYDEVIEVVVRLRSRLDDASSLRRDLGIWLAELELGRARQQGE